MLGTLLTTVGTVAAIGEDGGRLKVEIAAPLLVSTHPRTVAECCDFMVNVESPPPVVTATAA